MHQSFGTMTLEDGPSVAFDAVRALRRYRVLAEMEARNVDVLMVGRGGNPKYVAGSRGLTLLGSRPFAPTCVLVRHTRDVHLLSISDEGVPLEIPHAHLFPISWNPMNLMMRLAQIPGTTDARVIAVDGLTPLFETLLHNTFPGAELVDGDDLVRSVRRIKSHEEIAIIRTACALAEASLAGALDALEPGVSERELLGAFEHAMARNGVTTPGQEGAFCVTTHEPADPVSLAGAALRHIPGDRVVRDGDLVALHAIVQYGGYEGGVGRTWRVGSGGASPSPAEVALAARGRRALDALVAECVPGRAAVAFRRAWEATGEPLPALPIVTGVGLGMEPPIVGVGGPGSGGEGRWLIEEGMVLAVQVCVCDPGVATWFARETVAVSDMSPEVLSRFGWGPLG